MGFADVDSNHAALTDAETHAVRSSKGTRPFRSSPGSNPLLDAGRTGVG
jgi:hypothetical protein